MNHEARAAPSCRNCTKWKVCMERSRDIPCSSYNTNEPRIEKIREQIDMLNRMAKGEKDAVHVPF